MDYVFENFAGDGDQRDGAIVFYFTFVTFFKDGNDPGLPPVAGDGALIEGGLKKKGERVC